MRYDEPRLVWTSLPITHLWGVSVSVSVCGYYCSTYYKAVHGGRGGWWRGEDMCYERLRAEASVN